MRYLRDFAHGIKDSERGTTLGSPGAQGPHKGEAALLAVTMTGGKGPRARDAAPLEAGKGWRQFSLEPPEGPALPAPGFIPERSILDSWPSELLQKKV